MKVKEYRKKYDLQNNDNFDRVNFILDLYRDFVDLGLVYYRGKPTTGHVWVNIVNQFDQKFNNIFIGSKIPVHKNISAWFHAVHIQSLNEKWNYTIVPYRSIINISTTASLIGLDLFGMHRNALVFDQNKWSKFSNIWTYLELPQIIPNKRMIDFYMEIQNINLAKGIGKIFTSSMATELKYLLHIIGDDQQEICDKLKSNGLW